MLKLQINIDEIVSGFKDFAEELEEDVKKSTANLAAITHAKVAEMASQELHSSKKDFMESLAFEEISEGVWVVSINEKGLWIEEGIPANKDMKPDLLKKGAKISKDGHKYKVIPFEHSKASSQLTPFAQGLVDQIKSGLKKEKVPFKKIEKDSGGKPRLGKLHTFNMGGHKLKNWSTPALQGVSIYQSMTKTGNVRKDVLTMRTVSDGPASANKWFHPGFEAKHFLDRSAAWAEKIFYDDILPAILSKYE